MLIAEARLGVPYAELEEGVCVYRAEAALAAPFVRVYGTALFPDPIEQAAICARQLIRTKPLPCGNKAIGYEAMREMLILGECRWSRPAEEAEDVETTLERVEKGEMGQAEFVRWVRERATA
ncbi:MAG: death on curing protein [Solirubrobacterales bacterium]|nr:death on curing protein [Solirubrobacterales bacterium]